MNLQKVEVDYESYTNSPRSTSALCWTEHCRMQSRWWPCGMSASVTVFLERRSEHIQHFWHNGRRQNKIDVGTKTGCSGRMEEEDERIRLHFWRVVEWDESNFVGDNRRVIQLTLIYFTNVSVAGSPIRNNATIGTGRNFLKLSDCCSLVHTIQIIEYASIY